MSQVNAELGVSPVTTQISLGSSRVRCLFNIASGMIDLNNGRGKNNLNDTSAVYNYTGASDSWTVPSGVTSITVKIWGGGGGGGHLGSGGTAAFVQATLNVSAGQTYTINVGSGGDTNVDDTESCVDEAGGGNPGDTCRNPNNYGGGGNASVFSRSTTYIMAGGGGGGSEANGGNAGGVNSNASNGSADGAYSGGNGATTTTGYGLHNGATQADGQLPQTTANFCSGEPCGQSTGRWGGGGGSGWRSGYAGSGYWVTGWGDGGGGGGATSGYNDGLSIVASISSEVGGTGDSFYDGCGSGGGANSSGGGGKIVIIYGSGQRC